MTTIQFALYATEEPYRGSAPVLLGVFTTEDLAKAFAQGEEDEAAEDELMSADVSLDELKLEWVEGQTAEGDPAIGTELDQTYTGTVYVISPIRLDPSPAVSR